MHRNSRRDRLGGRAVGATLRYRDVVVLAGEGISYREISARVGYRTPSASVHALDRAIGVSQIRPGLAKVVGGRVDAMLTRLDARDAQLTDLERDAADLFGYDLHVLGLRLRDTLRGAGPVAGNRDVARRLSWRTPGYPDSGGRERDERLQQRMMEGTLDQIRGRYRDRSGVHRAIDTDLRRELFCAIAWVHEDDLEDLRVLLHRVEVGFRRKYPDWHEMTETLAEVVALLEQLGVVWIGQTRPDLPPQGRRVRVLRPWVADPRTRVAI